MSTAVPEAVVQTSFDLGEIYHRYALMVFRSAYRVTGDAGDAEDVLQTVFLRLAARSDAAETPACMEGYLRRAAVNAALDVLRSRRNAAKVGLDETGAAQAPSEAPGPDRLLSSQELRRWFRQTIASFSPRCGEIFALRYFEDLSNDEIAARLGTSAASVAVTLHRMRRQIQEAFEQMHGRRR